MLLLETYLNTAAKIVTGKEVC